MKNPFELHASSIAIEKTEDYHTSPQGSNQFTPKIKIAKAVVHCYTVVDKDIVRYHILHPAFQNGEIVGELPYKDIKDEEQALFAGVWDAFIFFSEAGYHHLEIVTTFKRMKAIIVGDVDCQNSMEEEMLDTYNKMIRPSAISVDFTVVDSIPKIAHISTGDVI